MEINKTITLLKNTLTTLDKSLPVKLADLQANKSELRKHMLTVLSEIQQYFVDKDVSELRSLHLCLLVNTLGEITDLLENDKSIGHIVGFIPKLSSSLYVRCVLDLDLLDYVQETLEQGPMRMITELLKYIAKERKHLNDMDACRLNEKVLNGCVIRMKFCECKFVRCQFYEYFKTLMVFYKSEKSTEGLTLPPETDDDIAAVGYHVLSLLNIMYTILRLLCNMIQETEFLDIYDIRLTFDLSSIEPPNDTDANKMLQDCEDLVFMKYRFLVNELDVSMFMHWHETSYQQDTLQNAIGEISYYICQLLGNNKNSPNLPKSCEESESMIKFLAITPVADVENNFEQKLSKEEIQQLISKELNSFAVRHIDNFLSDKKNKVDFAFIAELVMKLCSKERCPEIGETKAKEVVLKALHKSTLEDLIPFYKTFVEKFGFDTVLFRETVEIADLMLNLTEAYSDDDIYSENSGIRKDEIFKELIILGFQAPRDLLLKLLIESLLECHEQLRFVQLFNILKPACLYIPQRAENKHQLSLLTMTIAIFLRYSYQKIPKGEKNAFVKMLVYFYEDRLILSDEIMAYCILPRLIFRDDQNWKTLGDLLELFKDFYEKCVRNTNISLVVVIVHLAQLLDQSRWTMDTFSLERSQVYEKTVFMLKIFLDLFLGKEVLWRDERWLLSHVQKFSLTTKSYFYKITSLNKYTSIEWQFLSLIHKPLDNYPYIKELYKNKPSEIIIPISQLLPSISSPEMNDIVKNCFNGVGEQLLFILDVLSTALTMTCNIARQNCDTGEFDEARSKRMFFCLGQTINNFLSIIQIYRTDPGCARMMSYFLSYIHRVAVALKSFPGSTRSYQYAIMKSIMSYLNSLKTVSDDLDGDVRQIFVGLFVL